MEVKRYQPDVVKKIQKLFDNDEEYDSKGMMVVNSVLDLGNYYVTSMVPKNMKRDDVFEGGRFKIDKKVSKIEAFDTDMDREKYLKALNSPLYLRNKPMI